jgi:two-component system, response regulator, stage 0 sporulation protein F
MRMNRAPRKGMVLIVEDDEEIIKILDRLLSGQGYATIKSENGADAMQMAATVKPDVVILDLNLPDFSGIQVLDKLKAMDETVQVIILTAHGSKDSVRSAMELGALNFLTKPFEFKELCGAVREAFETRFAQAG